MEKDIQIVDYIMEMEGGRKRSLRNKKKLMQKDPQATHDFLATLDFISSGKNKTPQKIQKNKANRKKYIEYDDGHMASDKKGREIGPIFSHLSPMSSHVLETFNNDTLIFPKWQETREKSSPLLPAIIERKEEPRQ